MGLLSWLDDRTGYRGFLHAALYEHVPGGARWRYVWGSTLVFAFSVQMITGLFLWMHYSPSATTAWESVYYLQHEMWGGWLLRGIHHYTAQVMIVLLALHMLQVIVDGAYRAPREVNFWLGLILLNVTLGLSLTGYLLPWDQKGYWATKVATSLMGVVPGLGVYLQRLAQGGPEYGNHTLTRFFALHAGLLPFLMIVLTAAHVYVFRRHGLRFKEPRHKPDSYFWPDQVLRDAVACLGVLVVVLLLCIKFGLASGSTGDPARLGAELAAPADPSEPYGAARPEWYFLFLFQFLKLPFFAGHGEIYGAIVIPGVIMAILFLMPLTGRWKVGHWFNVCLTVFLATGIVLLTAMAVVEDAGRPNLRLPVLGRLDIRFAIVWVGLLVLGVLVLLPTIGRERSFRLNLYVLGALVLGVFLATAVVAAGGGQDKGAARSTAPPASQPVLQVAASEGVPLPTAPPAPEPDPLSRTERVYRYLLFALLGGLVLVITIALLKSPSRTTRRLGTHTDAATPEVTAAADAEAPNAAAVYSRGTLGNGVDDPTDTTWITRWQFHHRVRLGLLLVVLTGAVLLTAVHVVGGGQNDDKRVAYRAAVLAARHDAERVVELAGSAGGIPPQGAVWLLRNDPATQGPKLFSRNCASCHRYDGYDGLGQPLKDPQSAPDLARFASRNWVEGLLDPQQVDSAKYFGPNMKAHNGKMVDFVKDEVAQSTDPKDKRELQSIVLALSAEANLPAQRDFDRTDTATIEAGRIAFKESVLECVQCHAWRGEKPSLGGASRGPDLTGYGSRQWLVDFIRNPQHPRFYPGDKNDRMPLYGEQKILDERSIGLIADWIRGDVSGESSNPVVSAESSATAVKSAPETVRAPEPTTSPAPPAATAPATTVPTEAPDLAPAPATHPAQVPIPATKPAETKPAEKPPEKAPIETEFEPPASPK
jgi:quinol-cytochrome oxidoreductase complex cytochrome b subunit/mono/diheme cytochrome c family protein